MGKIKAVLDTNILVSMLFRKTLAREFSNLVEERKVELYSSEAILEGLARVITYPKVERIFEDAGISKKSALEALSAMLKIVRPRMKINVIKEDLNDNKILECAIKAKAQYIVSGDKHLLNLGKFKGVKIVTARAFIDLNR